MRADPKSYVRCGEVTQVDHAAREFTVWFNIHRVPTPKGERYNFERPLAETRFTAERAKNNNLDLEMKLRMM